MFHAVILFIGLLLVGCANAAAPAPAATAALTNSFTVTSTAFTAGAVIPDKYTYKISGQCNGDNLSPPLSWTGSPSGTKSFALTFIDPDGNNWVHWLAFNLSADTNSLLEAAGGPTLGVQGKNSFGNLGYGGPCPPSGTHHYILTLYALDTMLNLKQGAALGDVQNAMQGHILSQTQLRGVRSR